MVPLILNKIQGGGGIVLAMSLSCINEVLKTICIFSKHQMETHDIKNGCSFLHIVSYKASNIHSVKFAPWPYNFHMFVLIEHISDYIEFWHAILGEASTNHIMTCGALSVFVGARSILRYVKHLYYKIVFLWSLREGRGAWSNAKYICPPRFIIDCVPFSMRSLASNNKFPT